MPNLNKELVKAFNINSYDYNMQTNCTVDDKGCITMAFAGDMNKRQCVNYFKELREKTISKFYKSEAGAKTSFDLDYFPFKLDEKNIVRDEKTNRFKFKVSITPEVRSNLQVHLSLSIEKDIFLGVKMKDGVAVKDSGRGKVVKDCGRGKYVTASSFVDEKSAREFAVEFGMKIQELKNSTSSSEYSALGCAVNDKNNVYVTRSIFNNPSFVKDWVEESVWFTGRSLEDPSANRDNVKMLKDALTQFIYHTTGIEVNYYDRASYVFPILQSGRKEYSILVPAVKDGKKRYLNEREVAIINSAFGLKILNDVGDCVATEDVSMTENEVDMKGVYAVDFYNKDISNCVFNTIVEHSLITPAKSRKSSNEHELVVQSSPELSKIYRRLVVKPRETMEGACSSESLSMVSERSGSSSDTCFNPDPRGGPSWLGSDSSRPSTGSSSGSRNTAGSSGNTKTEGNPKGHKRSIISRICGYVERVLFASEESPVVKVKKMNDGFNSVESTTTIVSADSGVGGVTPRTVRRNNELPRGVLTKPLIQGFTLNGSDKIVPTRGRNSGFIIS